MGMNGLMKNRLQKFMLYLTIQALVPTIMGCSHAKLPGEYRESRGEVVKFDVMQTDPVLRVTWFVKLQDDTVIRPKLYYYQGHKTLIGVRQVEKSTRTSQTTTPERKRFLYLPTSEEIATYLLLIRTSVLKEGRERKIKFDKADYEMGDWRLLEIDAKDLTPEKPLVIPAYEELAKRELTKEQKKLLEDLVQKYEVLLAAAKVKANTPVKSGDKRPWWTW